MFENLIMLAGVGGAAVPLVIHLLSRARYRTVPWGAMMFIEAAASHGPTPYAGKLRERALLAVRMAVVGLLAVALARPVAGQLAARSAGPAIQPASVAAALLVDCSASMAHEEAGGTRMALARQAALRIISTFRRGDQVCLIPVGGSSTATPAFSGDLQSVATRVSELKPLATGADFAAALNAAADALERQESAEKRIYVVCDTQAGSWASIDEDVAASLRSRLKSLAAQVVAVRVGSEDVENLAVEAIDVLNPPAVAGCEAQIEVRVHNHGKQPRLGVPLVTRAGGRDIAATTINVAAGQVARIVAPFAPGNQPGLQTISAELRGGGDGNEPDDRIDKVIEVSGPLRALIVRAGARAPGTDYLALALRSVAAVDVVASTEWDARKLSNYQVVILDDAPAATSPEARLLEQFVYAGGGLLIAPGPAARIDEYNRVLYREESGLLPALLQSPVAAQGQRIEPGTFDTAHPLMSFLAGGGSTAASVQRYLPITARTASARILGAYSSGDPFMIESPFGAGKVVLITCALDAEWSGLPLTNLYLPLVHSTVRRLARSVDPRNVIAGHDIVVAMSPAVESDRAIVQKPDGARDSVEATQLEDRTEVRVAVTELSGVYSVRAGPRGKERSTMFAVAPPVDESDLTPIDAAGWAQFSDQLGFAREQIAASPSWWEMARETSGIGWLVALVGVLLLLVAEMWMTRRWSSPPAGRAIVGVRS